MTPKLEAESLWIAICEVPQCWLVCCGISANSVGLVCTLASTPQATHSRHRGPKTLKLHQLWQAAGGHVILPSSSSKALVSLTTTVIINHPKLMFQSPIAKFQKIFDMLIDLPIFAMYSMYFIHPSDNWVERRASAPTHCACGIPPAPRASRSSAAAHRNRSQRTGRWRWGSPGEWKSAGPGSLLVVSTCFKPSKES